MSFEYNGFIHRDLEPQVRYDAEQVQLLKQADVTINENLQTINESLQTVNTEISNKLTKPATPTAESAVILGTDGTTSTKPLSEIGGGSEKFYRHDVEITNIKENSNDIFQMSFLSRSGNQTTDINQIVAPEGFKQIVSLIGDIKINIDNGGYDSFPLIAAYGYLGGVIYNNDLASFYRIYYQEISVNNAGQDTVPANITHVDTVTEL